MCRSHRKEEAAGNQGSGDTPTENICEMRTGKAETAWRCRCRDGTRRLMGGCREGGSDNPNSSAASEMHCYDLCGNQLVCATSVIN